MKKIKLLIPALSIASVGAVVAPMVTSCGICNDLSFNAVKDHQWNLEYTPMTAANAVEYSSEQAYQNACANIINNNPSVWFDAYIASYIAYVDWFTPSNARHLTSKDIISRDLTISNAYITNKTISLTTGSDPIVTSMVSFDLVIKDKYTNSESTTKTVTYDETVSYHIVNMPYTFYQSKDVTPLTSEEPVSYTQTVAVPSLLYLTKSSETNDLMSMLAFIESGFSIQFTDRTTNSDGIVVDDLDVTIKDVVTLRLLLEQAISAGVTKASSYFVPLLFPVQPNYLAKATHK